MPGRKCNLCIGTFTRAHETPIVPRFFALYRETTFFHYFIRFIHFSSLSSSQRGERRASVPVFKLMNEQIVILDFGSQYTQVIARRIRECNVYSTILRYDTPAAEIARMKPKGIILSGGPSSVYAEDAPLPDKEIFKMGLPILGVCYGLQLIAHYLGREGGAGAEAGVWQGDVDDQGRESARCSRICRRRCRCGIRTGTS